MLHCGISMPAMVAAGSLPPIADAFDRFAAEALCASS
jgi:hypothetical protein